MEKEPYEKIIRLFMQYFTITGIYPIYVHLYSEN